MTRLRQIVDAISMLPDMEQHADGRAAVLEELDIDAMYLRCSKREVMVTGIDVENGTITVGAGEKLQLGHDAQFFTVGEPLCMTRLD